MEEMVFGRRYRVTEKIGTGGMAEVYKAVDDVLGRTVAVKVMHPRYAADPSFAARFRQEAQAAANLQSPYVVNIYDWGQDGDTYYIVMEYVRGTDLKSIIQRDGALPSRRVAEIGSMVCSGLAVAHGYDVIHRDVKPHNIMITADGSVKVMDFGIARAGNTTMTQTGSVLGTAHYVSPEQAQGRPLTAASDLYSLGIVLYEASTGQLPFDADTPVAVALKQVNEQPARPSRLNPTIDPGLERVIGRALAKDPSKRYQTAEEMRRDLQRVVNGEAVGAGAAGVAPASQTAVMPAVGGGIPGDPYAPAAQIRPVPSKRPVWPWFVFAAALVVAGLAAAYFLGLLGPQGVPVPSVTGKSLAEAKIAITSSGFKLGEVRKEYSEQPSGIVIDQSPVGNAEAEKGSTVFLTVSRGREVVTVPQLLGLPEADALKALSEAGLVPQAMPGEYSPNVPPGQVFKQQPGPGEQVDKGSTVQYVTSMGLETAKVPNVTGLTAAAAKAALTKAKFKFTVTNDYSDTVKTGLVISQNPGADIQVATGSTVTIVVSEGTQTVVVPDVIGRSLGDAQSALTAQGFKVKVLYEPHSNTNTVLEQNPSPNTKLTRGATVELLVDATAPQ